MTHQLKAVGLAFAAVLALSALLASAASANYTSNAKTTVLHGNQSTTHVITFPWGKLTCNSVTTLGHGEGVEVSPGLFTYKTWRVLKSLNGCNSFGFSSNVKMNGCEFEFLEPSSQKASTKIVCPAGKTIEIIALGFCTVTIGSQSLGGQMTFTNVGSGNTAHITSSAALTGLVAGGSCGSTNTATYNGNSTIKGYTSNALTTQVGISVM